MSKVEYPLNQIIAVKQRRVEEAEKVVVEKRLALEKEQKKLEERQAERDKVKEHKLEKLKQLREAMDQTSTSPKIQQMKVYQKVVDEKLKIEEKKVSEQKELVTTAEKVLEQAKLDLQHKRHEVDKLLIHKKDWEKEQKREQELIEGREQDELGHIIHTVQRKKH